MAQFLSPDLFCSIRDLDLTASSIRCVHFIPKENRRCLNKLKFDRKAVERIQKDLDLNYSVKGGSLSTSYTVPQVLAEKLCCHCHRPKRQDACYAQELRPKRESTPNKDDSDTSSSAVPRINSGRLKTETSASRYNLRSTGSPYTTIPSDPSMSDSLPEFEPMEKPSRTLERMILQGPSKTRLDNISDLYAFTRHSSPGYLKIGYSNNVARRMSQWSRSCNYQPIVRHRIKDVHMGSFIETLIHYELLKFWRRELRCKHNWPNCVTKHEEWFHIDEATAFKVMDNWVKWFRVAKPYDASGQLRGQYRLTIQGMMKQKISVTSQGLLDAFEKYSQQTTAAVDRDVDIDATTTPATATERPNASTTHSNAPVAVPDGFFDTLSAVAHLILSLTPVQRAHLQAMLDQQSTTAQGTPSHSKAPLVPPV